MLGVRKRMNRVLLYGPPGTGKTQLAHCLAAEVNAQFYNISSADILSSYVGESEKYLLYYIIYRTYLKNIILDLLKLYFNIAKKHPNSRLFLWTRLMAFVAKEVRRMLNLKDGKTLYTYFGNSTV